MGERKKSAALHAGLIWFGAAVSIAEIMTGMLIAPLGLKEGILAILLGHLIGAIPFFLVALIGSRTGLSAMEAARLSFGRRGAGLFSILNILQLIGWTAVMVDGGAQAAAGILPGVPTIVWSLLIGVLIAAWIIIGIKRIDRVNLIAMGALMILCIVLSVSVLRGGAGEGAGGLSFGAAVELSAAMPLSWLPLAADYSREDRGNRRAALTGTVTYLIASVWMYALGLCAALFTGEESVAGMLLTAGLGILSLIVIVFSTVTTTFLDAWSAGVSACALSDKIKEKPAALIACALGALIAAALPLTGLEGFLYLIGSVFAPMAAIQIADFFILRRARDKALFDVRNLIIWLAGFALYRWFLSLDTPLGNTAPVMLITVCACMLTELIARRLRHAKGNA